MKKLFISIIFVSISIVIFSQTNDKRIALVIGNSTYSSAPLYNPVNDANLMAATLQSLGFTVIKKVNATYSQMGQVLLDFYSKLGNYNVALFFYAGHGIQVKGINYLIPVDAKLETEDAISFEAISVNSVAEKFEEFPDNTNIIILDACRNNPFRSWARGGNRGFKAMNPGSGTLIAFATSEGSTASDGTGKNGLFTENLVKHIKKPVPIETVFKNTRVDVQKASGGSQSPQEWTKLTGDFYFSLPSENIIKKSETTSEISITEDALPPGTIKLTSQISGTLIIDGINKGNVSEGKTYTLNNIPAGIHSIQINEWTQEVEVLSGKSMQIVAREKVKNVLPNQLFDDRDNKYYKTVKIGEQVWMSENLAFNPGSNCWAYDGKQSNVAKYGYLYNWETAKYACPSGWRLPSKSDFETLLNNFGGIGVAAYQALLPGGSSGFSATFGGFRGSNANFVNIGKSADFWSSSAYGESYACGLILYRSGSRAYFYDLGKSCGLSVRCLQDN